MRDRVKAHLDFGAPPSEEEQHEYEELTRNLPTCKVCGTSYKPHKHYQLYCSDECEKKAAQIYEEIKPVVTCIDCGKSYPADILKDERKTRRKRCYACERLHLRAKRKENNTPIPWEEQKKSGRPRRLDIEKEIKKMEHERVWDDKGWKRYLKGEKGTFY